jgi:hypothetical protein
MPCIDKEFLLLLKDDYKKYNTFIETGTYLGETTFAMEPLFQKIVTIEVKDEIYNHTKSQYSGDKIEFLLGDSSNVLNYILPTINTDSIFFLDGHYSSGNTGKGAKDCPLIEELSSINVLFKKQGIIIIDDCRLFGEGPSKGTLAEDWEQVTISAVLNAISNRISDIYYLDSSISKNDRLIIHIKEVTPTLYVMKYITSDIIKTIQTQNSSLVFVKYGDGEAACAKFHHGMNCDRDNYTIDKGKHLIESLQYLVNKTEHSYIGCWHSVNDTSFWESFVDKPIRWAHYHSILVDDEDIHYQNDILKEKIQLYKSIKESKRTKIFVCNELLAKVKLLLNVDHVIHVALNNWYDTSFQETLDTIIKLLVNQPNCIVMTAAGMAAKPLIAELHKLFPNNVFLDFGSALDFICTKRNSRGCNYTYNQLKACMSSILPGDWESSEYDEIINLAQKELGLHV